MPPTWRLSERAAAQQQHWSNTDATVNGVQLIIGQGSICDVGCEVMVNAVNEALAKVVVESTKPLAPPLGRQSLLSMSERHSVKAAPALEEGGAMPVGDYAHCPVGQVRMTKACNIAEAK